MLQRLANLDFVLFGLSLNPQFIAFENNPGLHRVMELSLVGFRGVQGIGSDLDQRLAFCKVKVALRGLRKNVLALRVQGMVGSMDELLGCQALVPGISHIELSGQRNPRRIRLKVGIGDDAGGD